MGDEPWRGVSPRRPRAAAGEPEGKALIARLNADAARIAAAFQLTYRAIVAEEPRVTAHYGICTADGLIKIRLRHASRGTPLKYSSLVNTLCHELAHRRYFDHKERFRAFYAELLEWARGRGLYQPGPSRAAPAVLPESCGVGPEERRAFLARMRQVAEAAARCGSRDRGPVQRPLFRDDG